MTPINRQAKREQWKAFIEEQEKSGFSQAAFCKQHNLVISIWLTCAKQLVSFH